MEKASVRDLHIRTSELVRAAAEGAVIIIERRGRPVAELRAITKKISNNRRLGPR
jgi:antitoxin (DNA-binding transcriptional repressor) of toxin-antitoxin stability system